MSKSSKKAEQAEVSVMEVSRGALVCCIRGTSPLVFNRMAEKAKRELLLPSGRKTAADRAASLKHDPVAEYRASVYRDQMPDAPTRLVMPTTALKGALASAALDMPGASKTQIGRLTSVEGEYVHIYGVPQLFMRIVRSADMNKTPDVRTRAIVPEWAARVTISFVRPLLRDQVIANLLAAAGISVGIGDFRQEKGKGSFGCFELVSADDEGFGRIMRTGGRAAQDAALDEAPPYDAETEELLAWYRAETKRRYGVVKEVA